MLELRNFSTGYARRPVVRGVDLEVRAGEIVALVGANGAGKSTIAKAVSGLLPPLGGEMRFDERPITGGAISRLPPRTFSAYDTDPVLGPLLHLSEGRPLGSERVLDPSGASQALLAHGFRFVMLNRETSPPDLIEYVEHGLSLRPIAVDGPRQLFEIVAN